MKKLIIGFIAILSVGAFAADTTGTWIAAAAGRMDSLAGYSWSPATPGSFTSDIILVFNSGNSNQNATLGADLRVKQINANTNYTGTIALGTYTVRIVGGALDWGGATLSAGTSTVKFLGTSGTITIFSRGESFYDVYDSTMTSATLSTSDNFSCRSFTKYTTSSGALTFAGDSVYCSGDLTLDGTTSPSVTLGSAILCAGASSTFHLGSTLGTTSASSCWLNMTNATAGTIDDDKGVTFQRWTLTGNVTNSGAAQSDLSAGSGILLRLSTSTNFVMTRRITFTPTGNSTVWSLSSGYTWSGNGGSVISIGAGLTGSKTITVPAAMCTGTGSFTFQGSDTVVYNQTGDLHFGASPTPAASTFLTIGSASASAFVEWKCNANRLTSGTFNVGSTSSQPTIFHAGSGSHTFAVVDFSARNSATGASIDTLDGSTWSVAGSWTEGSNHTKVVGTSIVRITGTGTTTTLGKRFWDYRIVGSSSTKNTLADSLLCAYYYDSVGKFTQNGKSLYADSSYVNVSPDSAAMSADTYIGKSYFRNTAAVYRTAGAFYFDTTRTCTFNSNGYSVGPVYAKRLTIQDTGRIQKFMPRGDSCLFTFPSTKGVRIDTFGSLAPIVLSRQLSSDNDDAEQSGSSVDLSSSDIEMVYDPGLGSPHQLSGFRFNNMTIPKGATIDTAYLIFYAKEDGGGGTHGLTGAVNLTIKGEYSGDAAAFTSGSNNLSARTRTADSVVWSPASWTDNTFNNNSAEIKSVIQAIIAHPSWASGNDMAILINGDGVDPDSRCTDAYGSGGHTNYTTLRVVYRDSSVGDVSGNAGRLNYYSATTPGSRARLHLPAADTVFYTWWRDIESVGFDIDATDASNLDGGNNVRVLFPQIVYDAVRSVYSAINAAAGLVIGAD